MRRTDNDILAEYVRQTRPEIEKSLSFMAYKLNQRIKDGIETLAKAVTSPAMIEAVRKLEELKNSMTPEEWDEYINSCNSEEEAEEAGALEELGCGRCFGASFGDCEECERMKRRSNE